jgi:hypothetical protein
MSHNKAMGPGACSGRSRRRGRPWRRRAAPSCCTWRRARGPCSPATSATPWGYGLGLGVALRAGVRLAGALSLQAGCGLSRLSRGAGCGLRCGLYGRRSPRAAPGGRPRSSSMATRGRCAPGPTGASATTSAWGWSLPRADTSASGPCCVSITSWPRRTTRPRDALAAVVGLSVSLQRGAPPPPPPIVEFQGAEWAALAAGPRPTAQVSDRDGDGVYDHRDLCPDEAEGDHPDRARLGCPAGDRDGDGVLDPDDTCPDQARRGGGPIPSARDAPDGDDDGDGVVNQVDQCRAEAAGRAPDPQRAGCPAPDADGDMVPDSVDACPREAGAPATRARDHGCPGMVTVSEGQLRTRRPVLFAGGGRRPRAAQRAGAGGSGRGAAPRPAGAAGSGGGPRRRDRRRHGLVGA